MSIKSVPVYLIILFIHTFVHAQDRQLNLYIEGITYDAVTLSMIRPDLTRHLITGHTTDNKNWVFGIPDTIFSDYLSSSFTCKQTTDNSPIHAAIVFSCNYAGSEKSGSSILFGNEENIEFYITYKNQYQKKTDSGTAYFHLFTIENETSPEICHSILFLNEYFQWVKNDVPHDEAMKNWLDMIGKHPDSYTLYKVVRLLKKQIKYFTQADLYQFYAGFSNTVKKPEEWKDILDNMKKEQKPTVFGGMELEDWKTGEMVPVIINPQMHHLVIFSASWCVPCHRIIPEYKKLYEKHKDYLEIIYISIDEKSTVGGWKKLMVDEKIPWRSLISGEKKKEIMQKFAIQYIPYSLLFDPVTGLYQQFIPGQDDISLVPGNNQ